MYTLIDSQEITYFTGNEDAAFRAGDDFYYHNANFDASQHGSRVQMWKCPIRIVDLVQVERDHALILERDDIAAGDVLVFWTLRGFTPWRVWRIERGVAEVQPLQVA